MAVKSPSRKIYEHHLGKEIPGYQWKQLQAQLKASKLPLLNNNLKMVASLKRLAPRTKVCQEALHKSVELAGKLGNKALGEDIKREVFLLNPGLGIKKFYWVFRKCGFNFSQDKTYEIPYLGEVFYRLMINKNE